MINCSVSLKMGRGHTASHYFVIFRYIRLCGRLASEAERELGNKYLRAVPLNGLLKTGMKHAKAGKTWYEVFIYVKQFLVTLFLKTESGKYGPGREDLLSDPRVS